MSERVKMFELQGQRYQVVKVSALDGSNLLRKFTSSGAQDPQDFLANMPDEQFKSIQNLLLSKVSEIQMIGDKEAFIPLILPSGVIGGIAAENSGLVLMLTIIALTFNISDFFQGNALILEEFQKVVQGINA